MTDLHSELSDFLRYAVRTPAEVKPFMDAHHKGDQSALPVLADFFDDADDIRGDILRRHLGTTEGPEGRWVPTGSDVATVGNPFDAKPDASGIWFQPARNLAGGEVYPKAVIARMEHFIPTGDKPSKPLFVRAVFAPDELRSLLAKLPDEDRATVEELLDRHFAPKKAKSYAADIAEALRYAAKDVQYGTPVTKEAGAMARLIANGSNDALWPFTDFLWQHEHPAAPIMDKIRTGQAVEGEGHNQAALQMMHAARPDDRADASIHVTLLPEHEHDRSKVANSQISYAKLPVGHFFRVEFGSNYDKQPYRSFLVPTTPEEVEQFASGLHDMGEEGAAARFRQALKNPIPEKGEFLNHRLRRAGLGHLAEEPEEYAADLSDALKYKSEGLKSFVIDSLSRHPNPVVRKMASHSEGGAHPSLVTALFESDNPADHDAAVLLAPEDDPHSHSAHRYADAINDHHRKDGLEAKVVRGTAYLLDHRHDDLSKPDHYGAPAIDFTAPANDHTELEAMRRRAAELADKRRTATAAMSGN